MSAAVVESNGKTETVVTQPVNDLAKSLYGGKTEPVKETVSTEKPGSTSETGTQPVSDKTPPASTVVEQSKTESSKGTTDSPDHAKQLKAQAEANSRLGRELKEKGEQLDRALEALKVMQAKIDGTYVEPAEKTPEQIQEIAEAQGRANASRLAAVDRYGEEAVNAAIEGKDSAIEKLRKAQPWIDARIIASPLPVMEAMKVLQQESFEEKYGRDPSQWVPKIEAELKPKILDEFRRQAAETEVGKTPPTISDARGAGGTTARELTLAEKLYGKPSKA